MNRHGTKISSQEELFGKATWHNAVYEIKNLKKNITIIIINPTLTEFVDH